MNRLNSLPNTKEWDPERSVFTVLVRHVVAMTLISVVAGEAGSAVLPRRAFDFVALAEARHLDKSTRYLLPQATAITHLPCGKMY